MKSNLLTTSRAKTARACLRLHRIEYELGYRPREDAAALRFGSLVHLGLNAWWQTEGAPGDRLVAAMAAVNEDPEVDPFERMRAQVMLAGYSLRWGPDVEHYEVLGVEVQFDCELRNPQTGRVSQTWRLGGKIDVLVRDVRDGLVRVIEHKTSSEDITQGSEYWRRLRMDGQVSVYFEGARSMGFEVAECIYDVLKKPGQKPLQVNSKRAVAETPEEFRERIAAVVSEDPNAFYQRGTVVRLESEMEEALFDLWQLGQQLREGELAGRAPRNPDACVRFGRTCPFFDVCTGAASLDDPLRFAQNDNVHPELSAAPKEEVMQ